MSCHSLLACRVSAEKSPDTLMEVPLYVICCFPLVAFNILPLSLIFVSLITMCLGVFFLEFILPGTLCASWTWLTFFSQVREYFSYYLFKYFLRLSLSFPSGMPIIWKLVYLTWSQRSLKLSSFLFIHLSLVWWQWFPLLCLPALWSDLLYQLAYY